jgi:hypothetical protein
LRRPDGKGSRRWSDPDPFLNRVRKQSNISELRGAHESATIIALSSKASPSACGGFLHDLNNRVNVHDAKVIGLDSSLQGSRRLAHRFVRG